MKLHPRIAGGITCFILCIVAFFCDIFFNTCLYSENLIIFIILNSLISGIVSTVVGKNYYSYKDEGNWIISKKLSFLLPQILIDGKRRILSWIWVKICSNSVVLKRFYRVWNLN